MGENDDRRRGQQKTKGERGSYGRRKKNKLDIE